jgi:4-amino-4-deoxy-L-arabinose transferase-like glycosyltransferase
VRGLYNLAGRGFVTERNEKAGAGVFPIIRIKHYALLVALTGALVLLNLGGPSLWDIDEGKNAEAAREMMESGNWVIPTFNYQPRYEKPALLYWLQIEAYQCFGVNEFAARFPSALAALLTVLTTYELGRRMFGPGTGLLAGIILASSAGFNIAAHFANPDSLLNLCTLLAFACFWHSFAQDGRGWFVPAAVSCGLAVLAKGPVGLALPLLVTCLFLLSSRKLPILWDRRLFAGSLSFALTVLPWYAWVAADTKGKFLSSFLLRDNIDRFLSPMEHHGGPIFYYLAILVPGLAPWSVFLALAGWYSVAEWKNDRLHSRASANGPFCSPRSLAHQFLWCWIAVYLLFFSLAGTKLPNYILPVYAPLALLTGRVLERWRSGALRPPAWAINISLSGLALLGLAAGLLLLACGGAIEPALLRGRSIPGLAHWAFLGALPVLGALGTWWCSTRENRQGSIVFLTSTAALFIGALIGAGSATVDAQKAPRALVQESGARQTEREIRVGCYQYFQPSLVFYCQREVRCLETEEQAREFLRCPLPVYLFMPAQLWDDLKRKLNQDCCILGRHTDFYRHCDVVVVTNRPDREHQPLSPRGEAEP